MFCPSLFLQVEIMRKSQLKRQWSCFSLALLVFGLVCCANNTTIPAATAITQTKPVVPLGAGLNGEVDYSQDLAFADAMKTAGDFHTVSSDGNALNLNSLAPIDEHGWPRTDFAFYVNEMAPEPGLYHFSCYTNAQPTLQLQLTPGAVQHPKYDAKTKLFTAEVSVNSQGPVGNGGAFILILKNTNGGATGIKLIRPGENPNNPPVFHAPYLNLLKARSPNVLRFMDWLVTNNNLVADWSERSHPTDASQTLKLTKTVQVQSDHSTAQLTSAKGIAWEHVIELANELDKDIWINIPVLATDDYITKLAQLIKTKLKPNLKVYVEYSNEVWNDQFSQAGINRALAKTEVEAGHSTLNYDGATNDVTLGDRRVAKRLKEIADIFGQVFGGNAIPSRIRPVLAYQLGATNRFDNQLTFINHAYGPPKKFFYAIAVAPYFDLQEQDSKQNLTVNQVLDAFSSSIEGYQNATLLDDVVTLATFYGLKMAAYEGGPATFGPNNISAKKAATLDPRMKDLTQRYLKVWYSKGGDQFNWFTVGAGTFDSQYGTWSITNNLSDLTQPKELGYDEVRRSPLPPVTAGKALPGEVDARNFSGAPQPPADPYVRFISAGSLFSYLVRAPKAGTYQMKVSVSKTATGSVLNVLVNNSKVATVNTPASTDGQNDWDTFADTQAIPLNLHAGLNVVRLNVPTDRPYGLNSLKLYNADGSGISHSLPTMGGFAFYHVQTISQNTSFSQQFNVNDAETPVSNLSVTGSSDNTNLVPNSAISLTRDSQNPRMFNFTVTPASGQTGTANITFTVKNSTGLTRSTVFQLKVQ